MIEGNEVSGSVEVVSRVPQSSVLGRCCWYTSELFRSVGNSIVIYAVDTTIYALIPRPLLRSQVIESLNQDLAAINSWCLK